EEN
ncbi:hypothetical protein V3C99_014897, partial [Haemonchus contortus]